MAEKYEVMPRDEWSMGCPLTLTVKQATPSVALTGSAPKPITSAARDASAGINSGGLSTPGFGNCLSGKTNVSAKPGAL
jgi:hypothetical protein